MGKPIKLSDLGKSWAKAQAVRKQGTTAKRRFFLIVCEGEKTEPNYFNSIKKELPKGVVQVIVEGEGKNTMSLVDAALDLKEAQQKLGPVDKVWVVFDQDSFPPANFDNAVAKAKSLHFGAAWSNQAFELWYLIHFEDRQTGLMRSEYQDKLTQYLGRPYKKNDADMYVILKDKLSVAQSRATRLAEYHSQSHAAPHQSNPCTYVHELVAALQKLRPRKDDPQKRKKKSRSSS
jgi:hypothetical protein